MDKRYQVFVSSTYADLKEERGRVIQTLMEMDCIPAGMELFPALDEEQFEFIKKVIDDCDYYLLIIGGRYGSTTDQGISYTEKEFDYAVGKGLKVLAFLHEEPDSIPAGKTDKDPALAEKLEAFREKAKTSRLIKFWKSAGELPGLVALSLTRTIKTYPAIGWVRGNGQAPSELLEELHNLQKQNDALRAQVAEISQQKPLPIENLAGLEGELLVHGQILKDIMGTHEEWSGIISFGVVFALVAPFLLEHPNDYSVQETLGVELFKYVSGYTKHVHVASIDSQDFQTIKIQLQALRLIDLKYGPAEGGGMALFWSLTETGERKMLELRAVRASR